MASAALQTRGVSFDSNLMRFVSSFVNFVNQLRQHPYSSDGRMYQSIDIKRAVALSESFVVCFPYIVCTSTAFLFIFCDATGRHCHPVFIARRALKYAALQKIAKNGTQFR